MRLLEKENKMSDYFVKKTFPCTFTVIAHYRSKAFTVKIKVDCMLHGSQTVLFHLCLCSASFRLRSENLEYSRQYPYL